MSRLTEEEVFKYKLELKDIELKRCKDELRSTRFHMIVLSIILIWKCLQEVI